MKMLGFLIFGSIEFVFFFFCFLCFLCSLRLSKILLCMSHFKRSCIHVLTENGSLQQVISNFPLETNIYISTSFWFIRCRKHLLVQTRRLIAVSVGCASLFTCDRTQAKTRPKEIRPKCIEKMVQCFSTRWKRFPTRCNYFRMHWQRSTTRSKFRWTTQSFSMSRNKK